MGETLAVIIMLKDMASGLFTRELGVFDTGGLGQLISSCFAYEEDGFYKVALRLTVPRDVLDWEYNAILDYYDGEALSGFCESLTEAEDCYNPSWEIVFSVEAGAGFLEEISAGLLKILEAHNAEVLDVLSVIADKEAEYSFSEAADD